MSDTAEWEEIGWPVDRLAVVGVNHRTATADTRDRLYLDQSGQDLLNGLLKQSGLGDAVVLSTCNRTEIALFADAPDAARTKAVELLAGIGGMPPGSLEPELIDLAGMEALRHLFAVASSLDSLVIGEPEVLGQLKDAHRTARAAGLVGRELELALQAAYGAAKKIRTETGISEGPVSLAAAAVSVARDLHGDLSDCGLVLAGAGEMGEMIAAQFKERGLSRIRVVDRLKARARQVARRLDVHWEPPEALEKCLLDADILISAGGARRYLLDAAGAKKMIKARRYRPVLALDAALPGDLDPALEAIDEVFVYRLDDLEGIAAQGRKSRHDAADAARALLSEALDGFLRDRAERAAVPAITELRDQFEDIRAQVLREAGDDAEKATRLLMNRLLHRPAVALKELASVTEGAGTMEWIKAERLLKRLFQAAGDDKETKE